VRGRHSLLSVGINMIKGAFKADELACETPSNSEFHLLFFDF
jgi:hypothetical protein